MNAERRKALLRIARDRKDHGAVAILTADRTWTPDPVRPPALALPWLGLRSSRAA